MNDADQAELDERLARYARELDAAMPTFELPGDAGRAATVARPGVADPSPGTVPSSSRLVWLAAAAALVLIVAGSVVWWQGRSPDELGVNDSTSDTVGVDTEPVPDDGGSGTVPAAIPLTWEATDLKQFLSVPTAVTAFRDGWLAVGTDDVRSPVWWSSSDGRSWGLEAPLPPPGSPRSIAADDSRAVAVGKSANESVAWVTDDGSEWTVHAVAPSSQLESVTHTSDGFVAVGSAVEPLGDPGSATIVPAAWRSDDGVQWTRILLPVTGSGLAREVAAVGDVTVIVGIEQNLPMLLAWKDGRWWRVNPEGVGDQADEHGAVGAVAAAGDGFVAVGWAQDRAMMWTSTDGIHWPSRPIDAITEATPDLGNFADVAAVDGVVIAIPAAPTDLNAWDAWVSVGGGDWTRTMTGAQQVFAGNGRFVALGLETWLSSPAVGE